MIDLPDYPSPQSASPSLVDFGAFLTPALGGPVQRVERMGTRFRISVAMPPMRNERLGRQWVARLIRGKQEGARMPWPLLGFDPGTPGHFQGHTASGAAQSGRTITLDGGTPNYVAREGQFFTHYAQSGNRYLYMITAQAIADATGALTLSVEPMLRVPIQENDFCDLGAPTVEGFIIGDAFSWEMALANFVGISFDLAERE